MYTLYSSHPKNKKNIFLRMDVPGWVSEFPPIKEDSNIQLTPEIESLIQGLNTNPEDLNAFLSPFNRVVDKALQDPKNVWIIQEKLFAKYQDRLEGAPTNQKLKISENFTKFMEWFSLRVAKGLWDKNWVSDLQILENSAHKQIATTKNQYSDLLNPTA